MARLLGGIGLLALGIVLSSERGGELMGIFTLLLGSLMIVGGVRQLTRSRSIEVQVGQLMVKQEDLWGRLLEREPLDRIAEEYSDSDGIPPIRTLQAGAYLIREMQEHDQELSRALAAYIASGQIVDSDIDPEDAIDRFSFHDRVYYVDDEVLLCRNLSNFGHTPGTMVLDKGFLFFFERSRWSEMGPKLLGGLGKGIPILGVAAAGYELVDGLSRELADHFDGPRKAALRRRFGRPKSRAFPLVEFEGVELRHKKHIIGATQLVEVRGRSKHGEWRCLFTSSELQDRDWGGAWMDRLQIACIGEGNMLG